MIQPFQSHDALLADIRQAALQTHTFHIWWLGQSGFLVQWRGRHLLFDPYLSDSLTRKYAATDKPHVRMTELVIDPSRLDFIDVVTSSHNHTDHLDAETLLALERANPQLKILVPAANQAFAAERLQLPPERLLTLEAGQGRDVGGFHIDAVPAAHEAIDRDAQGRCLYLGYVVRFGPWCIYHSGDTVIYDGMEALLRGWPINLALLPINGRAAERRVAGNLWGREAAQLAHAVGARYVIPCHYEMFEFNSASPDEFVSECQRMRQDFVLLQSGQRWSYPIA